MAQSPKLKKSEAKLQNLGVVPLSQDKNECGVALLSLAKKFVCDSA